MVEKGRDEALVGHQSMPRGVVRWLRKSRPTTLLGGIDRAVSRIAWLVSGRLGIAGSLACKASQDFDWVVNQNYFRQGVMRNPTV